ncbi:MAG: hypothetical protein SGI77_02010 [Pirellulaceae bacterium]|nr:hypothetical protein [Pirellulaceae bacterium]
MSQQTVQFNRDTLARWYAQQHLKTDLGITEVIYLPCEANDREIRFVEINETMLDDGKSRQLIPVDFGVDMGTENEHSLWVLDVSSSQWTAIEKGRISLPHGWKLQSLQSFKRK